MTLGYFANLVSEYESRGVLVDTNLLVLYFVGRYNTELISKHKRTRAYTTDDFSLLAQLVGHFATIISTPNILTEASNLLSQTREQFRQPFLHELKKALRILHEEYVPSNAACEDPVFERAGLTDATIAKISKDRYLVLTDDLKLSKLLEARGISVINFRHIQWFHWTET